MSRRTQKPGPRPRKTRNSCAVQFQALETRRLFSFGDLDPLFGAGSGFLQRDFGTGQDEFVAVVVQPDGKIVAAGRDTGSATSDFIIQRMHPNGSLDSSFNGTGTLKLTFGTGASGGRDQLYDMALQPDGKIVVVGNTDNVNGTPAVGSLDMAIARINPNGTLDTTFSGDGKQTIDFGGPDTAISVALRSDGKIILAGVTSGGGTTGADMAVARLNANGTIDTTFGTSGKFRVNFSGNSAEFAMGVALDSSNRIVLGGFTNANNGTSDIAVARLNANGGLDSTFSGDGMASLNFPATTDRADAVAIDSSGRIVVAGSIDGGASDFMVARFTSSGALDTSFTGSGVHAFTFGAGATGGIERAESLVIRPDGKIIVAGYTDAVSEGGPSASNYNFAVARLTASGAFDTTFDSNGKKIINTPGIDQARAVAATPDGGIILAGSITGNAAVVRLRGALDVGFSSNGWVTTNFGDDDIARAIQVQPDGRILVAGTWDGGLADFAVARYLPDGELDLSFGSGTGWTHLTFGNGAFGDSEYLRGMALQPDGKIILAGHTNNVAGTPAVGGNDWAIARLNPDGSPDTTFSADGKVTLDFGLDDRATGVAVRPNGKIVVGGTVGFSSADFAVAQINADGTLDTTFGGAGPNAFPGASTFDVGGIDVANGLALQPDGRIVLAGFTTPAGAIPPDVAVVRFTSSGVLDESFGTAGKRVINYGGDDRANAVIVDSANRILIAGHKAGIDGGVDFLVTRLWSDGADDPSFAPAPLFFGGNEIANALAIQPDGKIVLAGYSARQGDTDFAVVRLHSNGLLDTTFEAWGTSNFLGGGNRFLLDVQGTRRIDEAFGVAIQPDGHILLAGHSNFDFALVRLSTRPVAASGAFEYETAHRVVLQFSANYTGLTNTDFLLWNLTADEQIDSSQIALVNLPGGRAQLTFPQQSNLGVSGILADGAYRLLLPAGRFTDTLGNPNVDPFALDFFFLMGDANRDGTVNLRDFNRLAANFGQSGRTFSQGNFNYDAAGVVSLQDFNRLAAQFGKSLTAPATLAAPAMSGVADKLFGLLATGDTMDDALQGMAA